ncbi:hypothetical protein KO488_00810 [Poseidonibacter lekithochrous]|uniref:hypothetical protein n=1 Tax=Poseidonibacter TaxID=2321187 RepID=UPI001C07FDED|nr:MULTISPECIES: hypothetical protein [Poseidonibacter]MBU3013276.1 hypothetical protein [Poseidonibacter lekithochrous]MDO6826573.1 hypothetical protein [Poseidonibacter sp. 1_MG-2023]
MTYRFINERTLKKKHYITSIIKTYYYHRDHQNSIIALTNKYGEDLTDKDKEKMDSVDDDCKDKIKKGLEKMKKIDYDKFLEDKIKENQEC